MSEIGSVLLAIKYASRQRDELAMASARVERNLSFAQNQMAQLVSYAADTDIRWTGSATRGLSPELVRHQYQFMDRLQQAIALQTSVLASVGRQLEQAKANLLRA